jgi:hypothetical protein
MATRSALQSLLLSMGCSPLLAANPCLQVKVNLKSSENCAGIAHGRSVDH